MDTPTILFIWSGVAHLVADWLLQNEWMVRYKQDLRHPAAWVHGAIHTLALWLILPWPLALFVGISHVLIDTRKPIHWWKRLVGKTATGPPTQMVELWVDQVMHIVVLATVILVAYSW
jgi:hypothetical protein